MKRTEQAVATAPARGIAGRRIPMILARTLGIVSAGPFGHANVASAAVPTFPDNVVVFPDRDFVTIEGYQDQIGNSATVTVTRNGTASGRRSAPWPRATWPSRSTTPAECAGEPAPDSTSPRTSGRATRS